MGHAHGEEQYVLVAAPSSSLAAQIRRWCVATAATGLLLTVLLSKLQLPELLRRSCLRAPEKATIELVKQDEEMKVAQVGLLENLRDHTDRDKFMTVENGDGTISLKTIWGNYVTAERDGTLTTKGRRNTAWEHFQKIDGPNGTIAFRSHHGKYMTVRSDGSLSASRDKRTDSELFLAVHNGDNTLSFFTWNRRFVTVDTNNTPSSEKFKMLSCAQGVSLRCANGSFLAAPKRAGFVTADNSDISAGCFSLNVSNDGKLSLMTELGKYITAQVNGTLTTDSERAQSWQQFRRVGNSDGTFSLLTAHSAFVDVAKINALAPAKHSSRPSVENVTNKTVPDKPREPSGPTLFCWSYTMTSGYEWDTIRLQREGNYSIFSCDDWAVFTLQPADLGVEVPTIAIYGAPAPVGSQPGGKLILNTDLFMRVWTKIKEGHQFNRNQWTAKVDVDAVFFPDRLREHLGWKGNPWNTKVFFKNCGQFQSMQGPLEVYSQAAIVAFFGGMSTCQQQVHGNFGEDIFMQHCLPMLGIGSLQDYDMVADQYCGTLPYTCACNTPGNWKVALHPCKSADTWLNCHKTSSDSVAAAKKASKTK